MAYWILKALLSPVFFLLWRVRVEGRQWVPTRGPAVLAANHQSFSDSLFLPLVLRRRVTYVAKAEYFESWKTAWFFRAAGQIPIRREGGSVSQRALDTASEVLRAGRLLGIYPEGTRSPDERLHRGHTGAARVARNCGVPIVPVGIVGTREVQPPGSMFFRPFRTVTVRFGRPLDCRPTVADGGPGAGAGAPDPSTGLGDTGAERRGAEVLEGLEGPEGPGRAVETQVEDEVEAKELRRLTDALMTEIAALSGQGYADEYATRRKDAGTGSDGIGDS